MPGNREIPAMSRDDSAKGPRVPDRRVFLKAAGAGGVGAAAAAALPGEPQALEPPAEQVQSRYRLNAHVQRFYFLNRL